MIESDGQPDTYLWCLHCERAYPNGEYRQVGDLQMCPYAGCDGDAVFDAWRWTDVRDGHATYPETPVEGLVYPLYGEGDTAGADGRKW